MITTFGHSTLEADAAVAVLDSGGVDVLIDVRSHPTSRFTQWRREHLSGWLPRLSGDAIRYQWWPELGGWDVRHAHSAELRNQMAAVGVDLAAYSNGSFPKQRIGSSWGVDAGSNPLCPLHGYSLRTAPENQVAILADATSDTVPTRSGLDEHSLRHLRDLSAETLRSTRHNKRKQAGPDCTESAPVCGQSGPSAARVGVGVQPRRGVGYTSPPVQFHDIQNKYRVPEPLDADCNADTSDQGPARIGPSDPSRRTTDRGSGLPSADVPDSARTDCPLVAPERPCDDTVCTLRSDPGAVVRCTCGTFARAFPAYSYRHCSMQNVGLFDYAWYTALPECQQGLDRLVEMFGRDDQPTAAIMCAECVWWRCHRSMLADVVTARGVDVWHLQPRWTLHADALGNRIERYPESVRAAWAGVSPAAAHLGGE